MVSSRKEYALNGRAATRSRAPRHDTEIDVDSTDKCECKLCSSSWSCGRSAFVNCSIAVKSDFHLKLKVPHRAEMKSVTYNLSTKVIFGAGGQEGR